MDGYDRKTLLMLSPTLAALVILFVIPLILTFNMSLYSVSGEFIGFDAYSKAFSNEYVIQSLGYSLYLASVSTVVATVLAVTVAMALRKTYVGKKIGLFLFQFNIPIPYIAFTLMMILILTNTGYISKILGTMGIISSPLDFPVLVHDKAGVSILLTYILKFTPFIGVSILAVLQTSVPELEDQAATLGANKFRTFLHVILPALIPGLSTTTVITFAYAFGTYEVPYLLGTAKPSALSVIAYNDFTSYNYFDRPEAYALATVMALIIVVAVVIYLYIMSKMEARG